MVDVTCNTSPDLTVIVDCCFGRKPSKEECRENEVKYEIISLLGRSIDIIQAYISLCVCFKEPHGLMNGNECMFVEPK